MSILWLLALSLQLFLGGMEITLDAEKMGQLIKLNPDLVIKDCVKESISMDDI